MQEENNHILSESLKKMAFYEPNEQVWNDIEAKLNEQVLQKSLTKLKDYDPNDAIWEQIDSKLHSPKTTFKIHKTAWLSIAASVTILLSFFVFYRSLQNDSTLNYSTEKLDTRLCLNKNDDAEKQYQLITNYCQNNNFVCQNPQFHTLKSELDELSQSSYRLREAIGQYNTDSQLIMQLTEIEQQRAEILRKMATLI